MANISAHPEGFNALRRMYETVQEPMMNAMQEARSLRSLNFRPITP